MHSPRSDYPRLDLSMSKFRDPKINISKVYTKSGDKGKTMLIGGEKVLKSDVRVVAYGDIDELNVSIGLCSNFLKNSPKSKDFTYSIERLTSIQNELFNLGTVLAATGSKIPTDLPRVTQDDIKNLEEDIDKMNKSLEPLESFVLPGGGEIGLSFHQARVVCRRSERNIVSVIDEFKDLNDMVLIYINRLSDYLFVLGRFILNILDIDEKLWSPNNITSQK